MAALGRATRNPDTGSCAGVRYVRGGFFCWWYVFRVAEQSSCDEIVGNFSAAEPRRSRTIASNCENERAEMKFPLAERLRGHMPRKLAFLLIAALSITAHAEEVDQPAWSAMPQAYATISNIFATGAPFNRALVLDQALVEKAPSHGLRFWFRIFGPNYRIYSEAGEASEIKPGEFLYSSNSESTCDLLFRLQVKDTLRIEGQARRDGSQSGARFCPTAISLPFRP